MNKKVLLIGITMGDPSGIGPEIILTSFKKINNNNSNLMVIGNFDVMDKIKNLIGLKSITLSKITQISEAKFKDKMLNVYHLDNIDLNKLVPKKVQAMAGKAAFEYIESAIDLALRGEIDAVVTGPINKEALHLAGHYYPGHTEIFAKLTKTEDYAMFFYSDILRVSLVSTHLSLQEAIGKINKERVAKVIQLTHGVMEDLGVKNPRIGVAGVNPHAGESGLFGNEERDKIIPAIEMKRKEGIHVEGPFPADTIFIKAKNKNYDAIVTMYHDQGCIPIKLLAFDCAVNVTIGLPIIRTSVDHGVAYGRAWEGRANDESMVQAIKLAIRLASTK